MKMQNMKRSETTEQILLFQWAERNQDIIPELKLMYHTPNEGKRTNGGVLKAAGLKSGVPDVCLPVAMGRYHGLYIELKFGKNKTTKAQEDYMALLRQQNYKTAVCYGAEEAKEEILDYLTEPGRMPKKACINAAWIMGKCEGIPIPSRIFARKECANCPHHAPNKAERTIKENLQNANVEFAKGIVDAMFYLSCGKSIPGTTLEETLETINQNLAFLVRCNELSVKQSAAVLSVAMDCYEAGKKERK